MFVLTFFENGGLKYVKFLCLFFEFFSLGFAGLNFSSKLYPLSFNACWYGGMADLKTSSFDDMELSLDYKASYDIVVDMGFLLSTY